MVGYRKNTLVGGERVRVALVHDWLLTMGGAERVLEAVADLYPDAPIFSLVANPEALSPRLAHRVHVQSRLARMPYARRWYRRYLPFMPAAIEGLDLQDFDLVLSDCSAVSKGVRTRPDAVHVSYIHTPMRYLWDLYAAYRREAGPAGRLVMSWSFPRLRRWDYAAAQRPTRLMANSHAVAARIQTHYGRPSVVVPPPVDVDRFTPDAPRQDYHLVLSRLVAYKRFDLAVEAANRLGVRLIVAGDGPERERLARLAGPTVTMVGAPTDRGAATLLEGARSLWFPGEEDFGIVMAEALAAGTPVVAYGAGGALDIVADGDTGILFGAQTVDGLVDAVERLAHLPLDHHHLRQAALGFDVSHFRAGYQAVVAEALTARGSA